ncbi:MAG: FmdB family zinc ribbon protein, partial [Candidatus Saccharicenans sp.]
MPIYEYICMKCQHRFELLVQFNQQTKITCPQCQSEEV